MNLRQLILMTSLALVAGNSLAAPPPGQNSNPNDPCSPYWQGPPPVVPCDAPGKARPAPRKAHSATGMRRSGGENAAGKRKPVDGHDLRKDIGVTH